jgi:LemA protein
VKAALITIGVLLLVAVFAGAKFIGTRNELATEREAVNAQWAQVDVVLQRRADLIPTWWPR